MKASRYASAYYKQRAAQIAHMERVRALLPPLWEHGRDQKCDEHCLCPIHHTPLIYWPAGDDHACQDVDCRYGRGMRGADPAHPGLEIPVRGAR